MLVEAAWVAVGTPGPLGPFYDRIRACRRRRIAVAAPARKLAVLCWHRITMDQDYAFARPSLTEKKLGTLELRVGMPAQNGRKGKAAARPLPGTLLGAHQSPSLRCARGRPRPAPNRQRR
jgi:transposase